MISPLKNGPQLTLPYSKCGRTSALYKSGNVLLSITAKDFFINPNTDFPFLMAIAVKNVFLLYQHTMVYLITMLFV